MTPHCCPCCDWKTFEKGVWKAHYALRKHVETAHPAFFAEMEHDEASVRLEIQRLFRRYGEATTRKY